jgi:Trypsin
MQTVRDICDRFLKKSPKNVAHFNKYLSFVDIMLVKLRQPSDVTPQQMNFDPLFPADGTEATVIGFGATVEGGFSSFTLQQAAIPIVPFDACDSFWNKLDKATQLCAGTKTFISS